MKSEKIIDAIGEIKDEYIVEAHNKKELKPFNIMMLGKIVVGALALCLIITIVPNMLRGGNAGGDYYNKAANYVQESYYENGSDTSYYDFETKDSSARESININKKLIVTGDMNLETMDLDKALTNLNDAINNNDAYIQDSSINTRGVNRIYNATIRIPADNYQNFIGGIGNDGNITYYHENTKDITDTYSDLDAKLTSLKAQEEKVLEFYKEAKSIEDLMSVESRLSDIRYQIDYIETQLKNYDLLVAYSTLNITITETKAYTETSENFFTRLGNSFVNGWNSFINGVGDFVIDVVYNIWVIIIVVLIIFGAYKVYKHFRNKKK